MERTPAFTSAPRPWRNDLLWVLGIALAVIVVMVTQSWATIHTMAFRDGDDALRLVQVRDLLAGQSWFDVSQHRINPPTGGLMHWSRLIDAQIAGLILLLRPFMGPILAEQWAIALYPPLLLIPLFAMIALVLRRLSDDARIVPIGLILAATGVSFLHYFVPLRIDHHNWQAILSTAMLAITLGASNRRNGLIGGLVMSLHLAVSLEALPYIFIFGGVFALAWLRDRAAAPRLFAYVAGLAIFAPLLLLATRGVAGVRGDWCDAWSAPYLLATFFAASVLLAGSVPLRDRDDWRLRLGVLALASIVGAAVFVWQGPTCLKGPFGALEPLVRQYWYVNVLEGQPVFRQHPQQIAVLLAPSLVGLLLTLRCWWKLPVGPLRARWGDMLLILLGSVMLSMLVARTTAVTHIYTLPALAVTGWALWRHARAQSSALARITGSLAVLLIVPPVLGGLSMAAAAVFAKPVKESGRALSACPTRVDLAGLAGQSPGLVLSAIDIGPMVLAFTPHAVVATGHHRNHMAMNQVISSFAAEPEVAETIVRSTKAQWLLVCPEQPEIGNIAKTRPHSLAAMLRAGRAPTWLQPVKMSAGSAARLYRITPRRN